MGAPNITSCSTPFELESALEISRKAKLERRRARRAMKKKVNGMADMFHKMVVVHAGSEGHKLEIEPTNTRGMDNTHDQELQKQRQQCFDWGDGL